MNRHIAHIALIVKDYDEAINFYTKKLGFILAEDTKMSETKRWVIVKPSDTNGCSILLAKAANNEQTSRIGNQAGGRVFLFLYTNDCVADYNLMLKNGIEFLKPPTVEAYGLVTVFKDLYGNLWDLIQPNID